jgi:peptide deformylase
MKLDNSILTKVCAPAGFKNPTENLRLAQHLIQLMMRERGIGLAANQAGIDLRLFVMFVDKEIFHCFNPEVITFDDESVVMREGCLSFPGERLDIQRSSRIDAKFQNARGIEQLRQFTGIAARCFQHELDHLNGITMHRRVQENHDGRSELYISST